MDNKEFKKILQKNVFECGFTYKNKNYYYDDNKLIVVINCHKSNYDNTYYINYGFWVKEIHDMTKYPSIEICDVMGRFDNNINNKIETVFCLDELDDNCLSNNIKRNIEKFIVPVIENGIEKYFDIYPQAMYTAKLLLKEYLKNNT